MNGKTPGLDAPMTFEQKCSIVGMVAAFLANVIGFIIVMRM